MQVIVNLVDQAAVFVLNVTAPNTHTMLTFSSQILETLIFQLLGNNNYKLATYVSFLRQRYYQVLQ